MCDELKLCCHSCESRFLCVHTSHMSHVSHVTDSRSVCGRRPRRRGPRESAQDAALTFSHGYVIDIVNHSCTIPVYHVRYLSAVHVAYYLSWLSYQLSDA